MWRYNSFCDSLGNKFSTQFISSTLPIRCETKIFFLIWVWRIDLYKFRIRNIADMRRLGQILIGNGYDIGNMLRKWHPQRCGFKLGLNWNLYRRPKEMTKNSVKFLLKIHPVCLNFEIWKNIFSYKLKLSKLLKDSRSISKARAKRVCNHLGLLSRDK